ASETSNKIIFCNYSSSSKSDSSEKIVSVKTDALNPFHSIIGTTKNISVYDMRFNSSPLLSWKHDFSSMDPPVFLDTILHSDIKSSVDNNKNICSIVAASKHKALISTFTYHQSRSNGSPVISLSRSSLNSFHSHESNKIQLLDNISQSQFYSSDLKTKIQRSEMYPFPNLDGIVIDKCFSFDDFDDDSNFYKTDGGMYGNNSTIYQFGQDGSLYSQNYKSFKISSNINSKKYKKSENSQNSAMTLLSNYLSDPNTIKPVSSFSQLESSQVTRDLGLNLIDSNGQIFISFNENYMFEEITKIESSLNEWPFIRRDFRPTLNYLYGLIGREKMWFSKNEIASYNLIEPLINSNSMNKVIDKALYFALDSDLSEFTPKSENLEKSKSNEPDLEENIDPKENKSANKDDSEISTRFGTKFVKNLLASEVIDLAIQYISKTYVFTKNGKIVKLESKLKKKEYIRLNTTNLINLVRIKMIDLIESRLIFLLLEYLYDKNSNVESSDLDFDNKEIRQKNKLLLKISEFKIDSIAVFSAGKVGISEHNLAIKLKYEEYLQNKSDSMSNHNLTQGLIQTVAESLKPYFFGGKNINSKDKFVNGFFNNCLYHLSKRLLFSSTILIRKHQNLKSNPSLINSEKFIVCKMGNLKLSPKLPTFVKVLDRLWSANLSVIPPSTQQLQNPYRHPRPTMARQNKASANTSATSSSNRQPAITTVLSTTRASIVETSSQIPSIAPSIRTINSIPQSQIISVVAAASQTQKSQKEKKPKKKARKIGF
ncbi:hypothetical protein AYI70_g5827, partial [Smittium culicis]